LAIPTKGCVSSTVHNSVCNDTDACVHYGVI